MSEVTDSNTTKGDRTYLVTSALERTWPSDRHIVFLGQWCLRYSRREVWSGLDYSVAPYHWDDRAQIPKDLEYINDIYEALLPELARVLNEIHGVSYSVRYWRIVVGSWLYYFSQVVMDRWRVLQCASESYSRPTLLRVTPDDTPLASPNSAAFLRATESDEWNERLCADIADQWTNIEVTKTQQCQVINRPFRLKSEQAGNVRSSILRILYSMVVKPLDWLAQRRIFYGEGVSLHSDYLSRPNRFALSVLMRQVPSMSLPIQLPQTDARTASRAWGLTTADGDAFKNALAVLIPQYLPTCFLEGFEQAQALAAHSGWIRNPRVVMTANAFDSDDRWKLWAAVQVDKGAKLVIAQHGGGYGSQQWSAMQNYEMSISDRYLTWGWSDPQEAKAYPAPATKLVGMRVRRPRRTGKCVQVTASLPRQSYWMFGAPIGPQVHDYIDDQFRFAAALNVNVREDLLVRLYHRDYGWDLQQRWQDREPTIATDPGRQRLDRILREARLYVATYNATTFLESFTQGIPTVIFWDPEFWELSIEAKPYFDVLRQAGILFDDPVSCAAMVNSIWDDVPAWWESPDVQSAVISFSERFAHVGARPLGRLKSALIDW